MSNEQRQAFLEDVDTVYQMWKNSDLNTAQQSHLGHLMFNIVNEAKIMKGPVVFYLNLRFIFQVIPDLYNYNMHTYLSFLGRINDPYDYLEKDTLVQTYKTAIYNYKPWGLFGYVQQVQPHEQCEDLTKRLRTGKIY